MLEETPTGVSDSMSVFDFISNDIILFQRNLYSLSPQKSFRLALFYPTVLSYFGTLLPPLTFMLPKIKVIQSTVQMALESMTLKLGFP